jgi:hypothetical protein
MARFRLLFGVSIFWLVLSMLFDGVNSLALPRRLLDVTGPDRSAAVPALLSFAGLALAKLVQPVAGQWSDRLWACWGPSS